MCGVRLPHRMARWHTTFLLLTMTDKIKLLRNISFGLTAFTTLLLAVTTFIEAARGTRFVATHIYGSPFFVALWIFVTASSLAYVMARKMAKRKATFLLHLSFVVILAGAFISHSWGEQGVLHLRQGDAPAGVFHSADGREYELPFGIRLENFELSYYPGTVAPMDFISTISVHDGDSVATGKVSMNNIYNYLNYRFYQSTYDSDGRGSTLSVYHDPYGIAVTYAGYALLLLSMLLFFFEHGSEFRKLLHHPTLRKTALCSMLPLVALSIQAADAPPKSLPEATASNFGDMYVYYNDRVCPLQTLARDFTVKLYGKASYKGMTAEQVLAGWFFYYDDWKEEPMIRIKSREVRRLLGIDGEYARLTDFFGPTGYKLGDAWKQGTEIKDLRGVSEADEKFSLVSALCTGNALKIFPYRSDDGIAWYSVSDRLPSSMPHEKWMFIRYDMNYIAEKVARKDFAAVDTLLAKTKKYQEKEAAGYLPGNTRFNAEKLYNALDFTRPAAMLCLTVGIVSFFFYCRRMARGSSYRRSRVDGVLVALMAMVFVYVASVLTLRGIIGSHFPASNGFETMQLMAACVAIVAIASHRRFEPALPFGFMLCGLALLVAVFGESNPSVTQLMPVLSSPLLSIHVVVIMIAYSLFGFAMFNGIAAIILHYSGKECPTQIERLQVLSRLMLYPAVFLLAAGIFIGAVWANTSWGRYWGWDPKETWALITLLIYAASLHTASLPALRRPMVFHWFSVAAFLSVIITYFGANFIMTGLHSYA